MTRLTTAFLVALAVLSVQFQAISGHHKAKVKLKQEQHQRLLKDRERQCKARWPLGGENLERCLRGMA